MMDNLSYAHCDMLDVGEEKEFGNQGWKKKLLKIGEGWETPDYGDEVEVHLIGTLLDRTQFESSRERGTPSKFTIGQGRIKGLDLGIKTMKEGENALFTIPAALAYGEFGHPPTIPPNAVLQFDVQLLSWGSVKDICNDGGIVRRILEKGGGVHTPQDPDEVVVNYDVRLEDKTFVDKSDGVEFIVQNGHYCPALSKAVKTMKVGEQVILTVKPKYGFGEKGKKALGNEGQIPANATLEIMLKLVSRRRVVDVTGNKKIVKKVLKEGGENLHPTDGAMVQVKLIGRLEARTIFFKRGHGDTKAYEFIIGAGQVIDGLDRAVMMMTEGEAASFTIEPEYAFGSTESKEELATVPPNSIVNYEVELVSFVQGKMPWHMNSQEKIEAAGKKEEQGNAFFKAGKYLVAARCYVKAANFVDYDTCFNEEEKKQAKALLASYKLNNATCSLKLNNYKLAVNLCTKVLEMESRNVEALHTRAQAYINVGDFHLAQPDIQKALEIDPRNREVNVLYKVLEEKMKEYHEKKIKKYGKTYSRRKK